MGCDSGRPGTAGRASTSRIVGVCSTSPRRGHVRAYARSCRSTSIAGDDAGIPRRPRSRKQGSALSGRPAKGREIIAVMRAAGHRAHGRRLCALIVIMWRAGLRIEEALALTEGDLDHRRGSLLVRRGKGGRRREVGMDAWGWEQLQPWVDVRQELPVGPLLCVINGMTRGRHWSQAAAAPSCGVSGGGSAATLRATPAPARPRRRNGPRRRPAARHPAPTRP